MKTGKDSIQIDNGAKILKDAAKISGSSIFSIITGVFRGVIVAKFLGPQMYGILTVLNLVNRYAGLANPGILSAAMRDIPYYKAKGDIDKLQVIKNTSFTMEILITLIIACGVISSSFFVSNRLLKYGLIIIAVSFLASKMAQLYQTICYVNKKFDLLSKTNMLYATVLATLVIATVYWFRIYVVIAAPIIASFVIVLYLRREIRLDFRFDIDRVELKRLFKIGFPLFLLTLAFWGFGLSDRTIVASFLSIKELGYYGLALFFFNFFWQFARDFAGVIQPNFQERLAQTRDLSELKSFIVKPTLIFAYLTPFIIGLIILSIHVLIIYVLPQYLDGLKTMKILSLNIFFASVIIMQNTVLISVKVNKQAKMTIIWGLGILVNICLSCLFIRMDWGIAGVALATVISQALISIIVFAMAHQYYLKGLKDSVNYYANLSFPAVFAGLIILLIYYFSSYDPVSVFVTSVQILIFAVLYLPCLVYLDRKTSFFSRLRVLFRR